MRPSSGPGEIGADVGQLQELVRGLPHRLGSSCRVDQPADIGEPRRRKDMLNKLSRSDQFTIEMQVGRLRSSIDD